MIANPFDEPPDNEGTVIRPRPAGVAGAASARGPATARGRPVADESAPLPRTGSNPLVAAAAPVLAATIRIASGRGRPPDPDRLRNAMVDAIRRFESDALATGLDTRALRAARYALCATIDDVVRSTPWGASSSWAQLSITSIFHNEVVAGDRFFEILEQMQQDLGRYLPVVELMYLCASLGFEGRYRVMPRGVASLTELREGVYRSIRQRRGEFERELSPHWQGMPTRLRALSGRVPLWARGLGTAAIAAVMYVSFVLLLANVSDVAFGELYALPPREPVALAQAPVARPQVSAPASLAPVAAPVPSTVAPKLRQFLAPEIKAGLVQVFEDAQTVTVRIANRNMFGSGEAVLAASYNPLMERIGDALQTEPGRVMVYGYTDNQPIRTARFPSNFELSQARADAVAALLLKRMGDAKRLRAQGKGDASPIASNATPDGRQQNRRTEIVLVRVSDAL
jgi:type VI secretion system protein ImpK